MNFCLHTAQQLYLQKKKKITIDVNIGNNTLKQNNMFKNDLHGSNEYSEIIFIKLITNKKK